MRQHNKTTHKATIAFAGDFVPCNITASALSEAFSIVEDELHLHNCNTLIPNLESSLPQSTTKSINTGSSIVFGEKSLLSTATSKTSLDLIFSLANNHIADYGLSAIQRTLDSVNQFGAKAVGASCDSAQVKQPQIITIDNIRFGILAFCSTRKCVGDHLKTAIGDSISLIDASSTNSIKQLKKQVDHVITICHWGREFVNYPLPEDIEIAHSFIDAGASLVIGHHPHVLQGYETYKKGLIFYSLGNFIFPEQASPQVLRWKKNERTGMLLLIDFTKITLNLQAVIPIRLSKLNQLEILQGKASLQVERNIAKWSSKFSNRNYSQFFERQVKIMIIRRLLTGLTRNVLKPKKKHFVMLFKLIKQGLGGRKSFLN